MDLRNTIEQADVETPLEMVGRWERGATLVGLRMACPVYRCGSEWLATGEAVNEYGVAQSSIIPLRACKRHPAIPGCTKEIVEVLS